MGSGASSTNRDGKRAIDVEYEEAYNFAEGLSGFKSDDKWGFIDRSGAVVIEPKFDGVSSYSSGRASIVMNKKYGYIDRKGNVIVEPKYDYGHSYLGELAGVTFHPERGDGAGTGYINRAGRVVWAPEPKAQD